MQVGGVPKCELIFVSVAEGNLDVGLRVVGPQFTNIMVLNERDGVTAPELLGRDEAAGEGSTTEPSAI
jgi:hypothetical protein